MTNTKITRVTTAELRDGDIVALSRGRYELLSVRDAGYGFGGMTVSLRNLSSGNLLRCKNADGDVWPVERSS